MTTAALALELLMQMGQAYMKARELAAQAGVSKEDLAAADARFLKEWTDPLNKVE